MHGWVYETGRRNKAPKNITNTLEYMHITYSIDTLTHIQHNVLYVCYIVYYIYIYPNPIYMYASYIIQCSIVLHERNKIENPINKIKKQKGKTIFTSAFNQISIYIHIRIIMCTHACVDFIHFIHSILYIYINNFQFKITFEKQKTKIQKAINQSNKTKSQQNKYIKYNSASHLNTKHQRRRRCVCM